MKCLKPIVIGAALATAAILAPSASAANQAPLLAGAGSSAIFQALADAAGGAGGATPACQAAGGGGINVWTKKGGGTMHDVRSAGINNENADVWVIWDNVAEPSRTICLYIAVDSGIGVRGFMAVPKALLTINQAAGTLGDSLVYAFTDVAGGIPAGIIDDINNNVTEPLDGSKGSRINFAGSDIRPEDAQNATFRALSRIGPACPCPYAARPGLGYGNPNWIDVLTEGAAIGVDVVESFGATQKLARPVNFHIGFAQTDPITGQAQSPWNTEDFGAVPVLPIVSNANAGSGGLGSTSGPQFVFNNVDHFVLSQVVDGTFLLTRDLLAYNPMINPVTGVPAAALPAVALTSVIREPLSGTYNTFEFTVPRTHDVQLSQEDGIDPTNIPNSNPLNLLVPQPGGVNGVRLRAIGTGDMVKAIAGALAVHAGLNPPTADMLGYAFWSYGNVAPCNQGVSPFAYTHCHYLAIDGVDGLYGSPSANPQGLGVFPTCANAGPPVLLVKPPCPNIPFTGLINGSYASWNIIRVVTSGAAPSAGIQAVITQAITQAQPGAAFYTGDILPVNNLGVFRIHRGSYSGVGPRNGHECPFFDTGSDVGGAVYTIQSDIDFFLANGGLFGDCNSHEQYNVVQ